MPRQARLVFEGMPHHVTQRGNYRQNVFESREDMQHYCYKVAEYSARYSVEIVAYCLMSNHVHFVVLPKNKGDLAIFFNTLHMCYSQYKNKQKERTGHLWQGRFYSSALDEAHLLRAVRYVEQNPVRAKAVSYAWDYFWSSARFHTGLEKYPIISTVGKEHLARLLQKGQDWKAYLQQEDSQAAELIRAKTRKGSILATEETIAALEEKYNILLHQNPSGRPKAEK